jgi:hypothetical protein
MMKKLLFLGALALGSLSFAQVLDSQNFNALTIGNVGTAIDASVAGQGGYLTLSQNDDDPTMPSGTTSTNANNNQYQIVANGFGGTRGLQLIGPNGNQGFSLITRLPFPNSTWANRTIGNNVVQFETQFNTGAPTTAQNDLNQFIIGDIPGSANAGAIIGFDFNINTKVLRGLGRLNRTVAMPPSTATGPLLFNFRLAATDIILPPNTWVTVAAAYDSVTGTLTWGVDDGSTQTIVSRGPVATSTDLVIPAMAPSRFQYEVGSEPTNTSAATIVVDNVLVEAVATESLLSTPDAIQDSVSLDVHPNPVIERFELSASNNATITNVNLYDMSGKLIFSKEVSTSSYEHDASTLKSGVYILEATTQSGATKTMKLVKQ